MGAVKSDAGKTLTQSWDLAFRSENYQNLPKHVDGVNNDRVNVMTNIYNIYKQRAKSLTIQKFGIANKAQQIRNKYTDKSAVDIQRRNNR